MDLTVEEFFEYGEPKHIQKRGLNIYYSHVDKYHWHCAISKVDSDNPAKLYKIDFEFADWNDFIDKILVKIKKENSQS